MKILLIVNLITLVVLAVFLTILLVSYRKANKTLVHTVAELAIAKDERDSLQSQLNAYTKPNLANIYPEIYNIIAAWCKEVGIYQVAVGTRYDSKSDCYKLTLYTERPGVFIGKAGSIVEKYKKLLQECKVGRTIGQIEIEEISGIVNQNQVDVEDYYNSYMANWFAYEEAGEEC